MNRTMKLILDIVMGTVIPVLILQHLSEQFGATGVYVVAALVPVLWVFIDLFFISKRFNFITSYVGASAILSGVLAFWFVDGVQFAIKDSVGYMVAGLIFGASLLIGKPIMAAFLTQALQPSSKKQVRRLKGLFDEPKVAGAIFGGTLLVFVVDVISVIINIVLNLRIVVAEFGTVLFNQQVAEVNAITRIFLSIPATLALLVAIALIRRAISQVLPEEEDDDSDIWDLLERHEEESFSNDEASRRTGQDPSFSGTVVIIGAGAAGLAAGYFLKQRGVKFQILEAASTHGGRMKRTKQFADFPIPLGAEWLTTDPSVFAKIVNNPAVSVRVPTIGYKKNEPVGQWKNGSLNMDVLGPFDDKKFVDGTWFDFFETYIGPSVKSQIVYDTPVEHVDYSGRSVIVKTKLKEYAADRVIVTVPLPMLQQKRLSFTPPLPKDKKQAIKKAEVWDGLKVFIEFSEKFYPAYTDFHVTPKNSGHVTYFDASYGQNTGKHILGLFAVGGPAKPYLALSEKDLKSYILGELDTIFAGKASSSYIAHIVQNWATEPFIEGAYLNDYEDWRILQTLSESVDNRVFFAGDAYTSGNNWGNVHDAALSANRAVRHICR